MDFMRCAHCANISMRLDTFRASNIDTVNPTVRFTGVDPALENSCVQAYFKN